MAQPVMPTSIRLTDPLKTHVEKRIHRAGDGRGSAAEVIREDLQRYYILLESARQGVPFELDEVNLILEAMNGTLISGGAGIGSIVAARVREAISRGERHEAWGVNGELLLQKVESGGPLLNALLVDCCERAAASELKTTSLLLPFVEAGVLEPPLAFASEVDPARLEPGDWFIVTREYHQERPTGWSMVVGRGEEGQLQVRGISGLRRGADYTIDPEESKRLGYCYKRFDG